jgi:hypothetical protein
MGVDPDINIIGTVMRNQKRKLFPDLFDAFKRFLDICHENNRDDLANKTYLYVHTSYPDVGWNIPQILKEYGISHKVLFTYVCRTCQQPFCSFFQDARATCPHCNNSTSVLPSVAHGLSREQLADVYRLFDVYVQYATNEGSGFGIQEAAACSIHTMATNYSACIDGIINTKGILLKTDTLLRDVGDMAFKAHPDNENTAKEFYKYFTSSDDYRRNKSIEARKGACEYYNWDKTAKSWENYIDSIELTGLQGQWNTPPRIYDIPNVPNNLTNEQYVRWLLNMLHKPVYTFEALSMLRDLNHGCITSGGKVRKLTREDLFNNFKNRLQNNNYFEKLRCGLVPNEQDDFIQYANLKQELNQ